MPKLPAKTYTASGQPLVIRKDAYTGLWNVWYAEGSSPKWAGPFRTRKETVELLERAADEEATEDAPR